jgi:hypothetical protein
VPEGDTDLVREMRIKSKPRISRRAFMRPSEFRRVRETILIVRQDTLAENLINPSTGQPVSGAAICRWETGQRPIPLWVARRMKALENAARTPS